MILLIAEFQYNNHIYSATQNILFLLDTGWTPHMGFKLDQGRLNLESVNEFKEQMESALKEVKVALTKSKDDMMKYYDQKRTPPTQRQSLSGCQQHPDIQILQEAVSSEIRPIPCSQESWKWCILTPTSPLYESTPPGF